MGAVEDGGVDCGGRRQKDGAGAQPVSNGRAATVMRCLGRLPCWLGCSRAPSRRECLALIRLQTISVRQSCVREGSPFNATACTGRAFQARPHEAMWQCNIKLDDVLNKLPVTDTSCQLMQNETPFQRVESRGLDLGMPPGFELRIHGQRANALVEPSASSHELLAFGCQGKA